MSDLHISGMTAMPAFHTVLVVVVLLAIGLALLHKFVGQKTDPREPPYLPSTVPVVGHMINGIREGARYYDRLEKLYHQHLYTLAMPTGRMYLVTSPDWALAVHKATKTLSFNTLVAQAMEKVFCMDGPTMAIVNDNLNAERGDRSGLILETHDIIQVSNFRESTSGQYGRLGISHPPEFRSSRAHSDPGGLLCVLA